jgi:hypothetical protein
VKAKRKKKALAPLSLYPLTPDKAIADVFKINPKLQAAERRKVKRKKR